TARRRLGRLAARPAGRLPDPPRARAVRLAPPAADAPGVPAAAGRLRRGRGALAVQAPGQVQRPRRRQVARRAIRAVTPGPAPGGTDHLPRYLRLRSVPVPLPAGASPLGHVAEHPGVAPGGRARGAGGAVLAARLGRPRDDAGAVGPGRRLAGRAGTARPAA